MENRTPGCAARAAVLPNWRVLAAGAVVQIIGASVAIHYHLDHSFFLHLGPWEPLFMKLPVAFRRFYYVVMNFWLGAALATPIGVAAGLAWQFSGQARRENADSALTPFLIAGAVLFPMIAIAMLFVTR